MTKSLIHHLVLVALLVSGCDFAPKYAAPNAPVPPEFKETEGWTLATPADSIPRGNWWLVFNDPTLDQLESHVTDSNQDLKAAIARYDEARADALTAQADYYPTINALGYGNRIGLSRDVANPLPTRSFKSIDAGFDFSYEIDVWGRVRNEAKVGESLQQAARGDLATIELSLHSELAYDYFILRGDDAAQDVLELNVQNFRKALELTEARFNVGYAAKPDVSAAEAQLQNTVTQATDIRLKRAKLEHAIAILTGRPPSGFELPKSTIKYMAVNVAPVLPATLLERRPDIAAAERRVAAANADIGVAKAAYFPSFNLNALFGVQSAQPDRLFSAPAEVWSLGPSALLTLIDGGKRRALNDRARSAYELAAAQYRQTVLLAYGEVEDSIASLRLLEREAATQQAAVTAATDSTDQATRLYKGGIDNYFNVIVAQNIQLAAELSQVNIATRRMTANISLIKALGGGWQREDGLAIESASIAHSK